MRILILTQWFDPEPTPRGLAFAKSLQQAGHDIEIITGFPNYPGGKIYPGHKMKWRKRGVVDNVIINRVALYMSHDQSAIRRALNHISFFISSLLYGLFFTKKVDVIYVYSQPILVGLSGAFISLFRRTPFIIDIQDIWPDSVRASGMLNNPRLLNLIEKLCNWIYKRAKQIIVISPGFKKLLIQRDVPEEKIHIIYNWCDENELTSSINNSTHEFLDAKYFNVVFAGTMGKAQALESVIFAAKQIAAINPKVKFVFIGGGVEKDKLEKASKTHSLTNVVFLPRVLAHEIGAVLNASDVLLVHLKDDPLFDITIPSKIQSYLCIGKPIMIAARGDAVDLILTSRAGMQAEPENIDSIVRTVLSIADLPKEKLMEMGFNGANFYQKSLSMNVGVSIFLKIFENVFDKNSIIKNGY